MSDVSLYRLNRLDSHDQDLKDRVHERLMANSETDAESECWIYLSCWDPKGTAWIRVGRRPFSVAKAAAWIYLGCELWSGWVYHICESGACFNPDHLRVAASQKDMHDALRRLGKWGSFSGRGDRSRPGRRFDADRVRRIREVHAQGTSIEDLARQEGVRERAIRDLVTNVTWRCVDGSEEVESV